MRTEAKAPSLCILPFSVVGTQQVLKDAGRSAEGKEGVMEGGWQRRPLRKQ